MTDHSNADVVRKLAAECMLFLKRDGSFPLDRPCDVALFGSGARNTVRGGTGSGDVYSKQVVNIEDGLNNNGFTVTTTKWLDRYDELKKTEKERWIREMRKTHRGIRGMFSMLGAIPPEPVYDLSLDYPGEVCIYVLSRISGEGTDRMPERGDILLSETEIRDILELDSAFEKFLLVLNTGGPVDLSEISEVRNILVFSQAGPLSGDILCDIILGRSDPCGKLATTWTKWEDYCSIGDFGERDETAYKEGIYVGYRYFDTVGKRAMYPFGFGLSYTDFGIDTGDTAVCADGSAVTVTVKVTNTGNFAGKEVVQIYVSVPEGKLDQPYQALAAFCKTDPIMPGESRSVSASFDLKDLASYDSDTGSYILEKGDYIVRAGNSSINTKPVAVLSLDRTVTVRKVRNTFGECGFDDWQPDRENNPAISDVPRIDIDFSAFKTEVTVYDREYDTDPFISGLSDEELCHTGVGRFSGSPLNIIGSASAKVAGAAGDLTDILEGKGFPCLVCSDGPAGIRIEREYYKDDKGLHGVNNDSMSMMSDFLPGFIGHFLKPEKKIRPGTKIYEQNCTMIPAATAVAQSFDTALAQRLGDIVGEEMERYGIDFWLAPALNIHRNIRCGRNFEYYSEDPLVAGKIASAVVRGVQSHKGRYATIKHCAANNQETNRYSSNSLVSERAMREIYLRAFGICIRESDPTGLMTSYNLVNGTHTASHRGLIEDVLRCEFGFSGIVMTDWIVSFAMGGGKYELPLSYEVAAAGGDVMMPGSKRDYKILLKGLKTGRVSRKQLEINATRIYRIAAKKV